MTRFVVVCLLLALFACDSGEQKKEEPKVEVVVAPPQVQEPQPSPSEVAKADRIIAWTNRVNDSLENGYYSLAGSLYASSRRYLEDWSLPKKIRRPDRVQLRPEAGIFNEDEAKLITDGLEGMDRALDNMLAHYASLDKYVADKNIVDDGKMGRELAGQIESDHVAFMAARKSWREIVRKRAAAAQKILLYRHPLKRQILAGNDIFAQFTEVTDLLASGGDERALLTACSQNIKDLLAVAQKPPFPARPALERLYRDFLRATQRYIGVLDRGIPEGFHNVVRQELNAASQECAARWNEFAKEANRG